ncbi:MAG TPA: TlpA disulfide reductase family protein [Fimbriimonadaceae bacterium]|nr:TlpA disulfide reductase family protein [Fimbriimonadaceae bacterium]
MLVAALSLALQPLEPIRLTPFAEGAPIPGGSAIPRRIELSPEAPTAVKRVTADLIKPAYGVMDFGPAENRRAILIAIDRPATVGERLWVDANGDGDLTNDPRIEWERTEFLIQGATQIRYSASVWIESGYHGPLAKVKIKFYRQQRFAPGGLPQDPTAVLAAGEYGYAGKITLSGLEMKAALRDELTAGDFRPGADSRSVQLYLDVNGNGRFEGVGERFDAGRPFTLVGTTYQIASITPSGDSFVLAKSADAVPEVLPPPNLDPGAVFPPFTAKTIDGHNVSFPSGMPGKVALLVFWATWDAASVTETANWLRAYEEFRGDGLSILGVSLDPAESEAKLQATIAEKKIAWPQVFEGRFWESPLAKRYGVVTLPFAVLVDRATGKVIASGDALRAGAIPRTYAKGETRLLSRLEVVIERVLGKRLEP